MAAGKARIDITESTTPKMKSVSSSNIAKIGYDTAAKNLYVLFHSGKLYVYYGVGEKTAIGMIEAPSHGKYLDQNIKDRFEYDEVEAPAFMLKGMPSKKKPT